MASACVNSVGISPDSFLDCPPVKCPSYGWLSPRISFSRELPDEEAFTKPSPKIQAKSDNVDAENKPKASDPVKSGKDFVDFEFRLEDPVKMLAADELFSDGKLVPLHLSTIRRSMTSAPESSDVRSADDSSPYFRQRKEISSADMYLFSPKAPTCSSRWKGLLGLKKLYQNSSSSTKQEDDKTPSYSSQSHNKNSARGLKHFLHRGSKSALNASVDSSLNLPLLKEPDSESLSVSSRLSLSSSSSGHEYDELPRLSLDSDKPSSTIPRNSTHQTASNLSKVRVVKHRAAALSSENPTSTATATGACTRVGRSPMRRTPESTAPARDVSVDSPRMNSSGKVVFHSLERSSSSPSTFNGGPRHKHGGVERSYSANVRISPVLNVPVCTIRGSSKSGAFGFPLFSSQQKRDTGVGPSRRQQNHGKNRIDRT